MEHKEKVPIDKVINISPFLNVIYHVGFTIKSHLVAPATKRKKRA